MWTRHVHEGLATHRLYVKSPRSSRRPPHFTIARGKRAPQSERPNSMPDGLSLASGAIHWRHSVPSEGGRSKMINETSSTISLRNFLPISKKLRERNGSVRGDKKYESITTQTEADSAQGMMCAMGRRLTFRWRQSTPGWGVPSVRRIRRWRSGWHARFMTAKFGDVTSGRLLPAFKETLRTL